MAQMGITKRLELIAHGEHLDLADIVARDAIAEIKHLRASLKEAKDRLNEHMRLCPNH